MKGKIKLLIGRVKSEALLFVDLKKQGVLRSKNGNVLPDLAKGLAFL